MRVFVRLALAAVALSFALQARGAGAEEPDFAGMLLKNQTLLSAPPKGCEDKNASLNTFELQQCSAVAFQKADIAMTHAYAAGLKAGTSGRNQRLKLAQRQWLAFRNAECDWQSLAYEGGSQAPVTMGTCLVEVTLERVRQLTDGAAP